MDTKSKDKRPAKKTAARVPKKRSAVGASIIKGLEEAVAWTHGKNENGRVTLVPAPEVDVREVRTRMVSARLSSRPGLASRRPRCGIGSGAGRGRMRRPGFYWW
jgi:hypothetical protein